MVVSIAAVSTTYFGRRTRTGSTHISELSQALVKEIREIRHEIRLENGGGGMCHLVGEYLEVKYGWPRPYVAILADDGRVICAPHVVNILPDGSLLDSTRDQFGFANDIAIVKSGSPEMANYRPEFDWDCFPKSRFDEDGHFLEYLDIYLGKPDDELAEDNLTKYGRGWWLTDLKILDAYDEVNGEYRRTSDFQM